MVEDGEPGRVSSGSPLSETEADVPVARLPHERLGKSAGLPDASRFGHGLSPGPLVQGVGPVRGPLRSRGARREGAA